jgi:CelD/BcsL family acetyltransferase involved in cellulose biosynthesis
VIREREQEAVLRAGEIRGRAGWMALREDWNGLADAARAPVFLRHEFLSTWLDNFAPAETWRTWYARGADGVLHGALPTVQRRTSVLGVPVTELAGAANVHSCRFDLLCRPGAEQAVASALEGRLAQERWDVLRIPDVPEGGAAHRLLDAARARGAAVGTWRSLESPWFPLPGTWEAVESTLDARFKANCRRRRRKLAGHGEIELQRVTGGPALEAVLEEGFSLEAAGWKGRGGTAMAQDRSTRGFYVELARVAAERGWLSLYVLRVQGRAVAFHYGLVHGGRYLLLKPAYDEQLGACSPGQLLVEDVAREGISRGWSAFDFLGPDMPWKRDWTDRRLAHQWLYVFRDSALGRALAAAKFRLVPAVREVVSRWKR